MFRAKVAIIHANQNIRIPDKGLIHRLTVVRAGAAIASTTFIAIPSPSPEVRLRVGMKDVDMKEGIPYTDINRLRLAIVPEDNFATELPSEARYSIDRWNVALIRETGFVFTVEGRGEQVKLATSDASKIKSGDRLVFEISNITRLNGRGAKEEIVPATSSRYLSLQIK
jgi:hypothetical protein